MDENLGYIAFDAQRPRFLDVPEQVAGDCRVAESTQTRIDAAIRVIVMGVFERALSNLTENRETLDRSAQALRKKETLEEADIRVLTAGLRHPQDATDKP